MKTLLSKKTIGVIGLIIAGATLTVSATVLAKDFTKSEGVATPPTSDVKFADAFQTIGTAATNPIGAENVHYLTNQTANAVQVNWARQPIDIGRAFYMKFFILMQGDLEGVTWTMHRDKRKTQAVGSDGESLGVYPKLLNKNSQVMDKASDIDAGLAIEFDNRVNSTLSLAEKGELKQGSADVFSVKKNEIKTAHIGYAWTEANSLNGPVNADVTSRGYWGSISMLQAKPQSLNDGQWHAIELMWQPLKPTSGEVADTYRLTTRLDGETVLDYGDSQNTKIKTAHFQIPKTAIGYDAVWGFSGANSSLGGVSAVAVTDVDYLQPKLTYLVRNVSNGETKFVEKTAAQVDDELEFKVSATGFTSDWHNVDIKGTLPEGVTLIDEDQFTIETLSVGETVTKKFKGKVSVNKTTTLTSEKMAFGENWYSDYPLYSNKVSIDLKERRNTNAVKLTVKGEIQNKDYPDAHNALNTEINSVLPGEHITAKFDIENTQAYSELLNGQFRFSVPIDSEVSSVTVDGKPVEYKKYQTKNQIELAVLNFKIVGIKKQQVVINYTAGVAGKKPTLINFISKGYIRGDNPDKSKFEKELPELTINFATETIAFQPHNIDFGVHASFRKDELVKRTAQTNHPNVVVDITDGRRVLSQARLTVQQQRQLSLVDYTQQLLPSRLRYYNKQGSFEDLLDHPVVVTETKDSEPMASVTWQNDEGILFFTNGNNFRPGLYHTEIIWSIVQGY